MDWDPSKWAILLLHYSGLASGLRRARVDEIKAARDYMRQKEEHGYSSTYSSTSSSESSSTPASTDYESDQWDGEYWTQDQAIRYAKQQNRCVIVLGGYAVDVTRYLAEHVRVLVLAPPTPVLGVAHAVDSPEERPFCDDTRSARRTAMRWEKMRGPTRTGPSMGVSINIPRQRRGACASSG